MHKRKASLCSHPRSQANSFSKRIRDAEEHEISDLPNEIVAIILQNLDTRSFLEVRSVCKRWRGLSNFLVSTSQSPLSSCETVLRTNADYKLMGESTREFESKLGTPFPSGAVCLRGFRIVSASTGSIHFETHLSTPAHASFFQACGTYISHLRIQHVNLSTRTMLHILCYTRLKSLQLSDCNWTCEGVENQGYKPKSGLKWHWEKAKNTLSELERLEIDVGCFLHSRGPDIPEKFLKLNNNSDEGEETFDLITYLTAVTPDFSSFLCEFLKCGSALKTLKVTGCDISVTRPGAASNDLTHWSQQHEIINALKGLEKLQILSLKLRSDLRVLSTLTADLPFQLTELQLEFYQGRITPRHLSLLEAFSKTLRTLQLDFTLVSDQTQFLRDDFRDYRLNLIKLESLKLGRFRGHLDFLKSFSKTLLSLEICSSQESIQTVFQWSANHRFFEALPRLKRLILGFDTFTRSA